VTAFPDERQLSVELDNEPNPAEPAVASTADGHPCADIVALPTEVDVNNDGQVRDLLAVAIAGGKPVVVVDASGTTFCGCRGVSVLVDAHRHAAATGAQLRLVVTTAEVLRVLEITGADRVLCVYPSLADAEADPGPSGCVSRGR